MLLPDSSAFIAIAGCQACSFGDLHTQSPPLPMNMAVVASTSFDNVNSEVFSISTQMLLITLWATSCSSKVGPDMLNAFVQVM